MTVRIERKIEVVPCIDRLQDKELLWGHNDCIALIFDCLGPHFDAKGMEDATKEVAEWHKHTNYAVALLEAKRKYGGTREAFIAILDRFLDRASAPLEPGDVVLFGENVPHAVDSYNVINSPALYCEDGGFWCATPGGLRQMVSTRHQDVRLVWRLKD